MTDVLSLVVTALLSSGGASVLTLAIRGRAEVRQVDATTGRTDAERHKVDAEAAAVISEASVALLAPMKAEITRLESQLTSAREEADRLIERMAQCERRVQQYEAHFGPLPA